PGAHDERRGNQDDREPPSRLLLHHNLGRIFVFSFHSTPPYWCCATRPRPNIDDLLSALDVDELLKHLVRRRDRLGVRGERALVLDEAHELFGQIDVRALERTSGDRSASAAAGGPHGGGTALARVDPQVL